MALHEPLDIPIQDTNRWRQYLEARTRKLLKTPLGTEPPNRGFEDWAILP